MVIVELAIGLIFVYLLFSLVISTINEIIARFIKDRARVLRQSLGELFECNEFRDHLYDHPLISGLKLGDNYPTYIPSSNFPLAVINLAVHFEPPTRDHKGQTTITNRYCRQEKTRTLFESLVGNTGGSAPAAQQALEKWFDDSMKRVSGRYKRRSQWWVFGLAALMSVFFNVDTLQIVNRLYYDPALRATTANQAQDFVKGAKDAEKAEKNGFPKAIADLRVPLGWPDDPKDYFKEKPLSHILGLFFSTIALSLGAPFWFDVLNKIVNVRQAGPPPVQNKTIPVVSP
jgi:hypothetical protein